MPAMLVRDDGPGGDGLWKLEANLPKGFGREKLTRKLRPEISHAIDNALHPKSDDLWRALVFRKQEPVGTAFVHTLVGQPPGSDDGKLAFQLSLDHMSLDLDKVEGYFAQGKSHPLPDQPPTEDGRLVASIVSMDGDKVRYGKSAATIPQKIAFVGPEGKVQTHDVMVLRVENGRARVIPPTLLDRAAYTANPEVPSFEVDVSRLLYLPGKADPITPDNAHALFEQEFGPPRPADLFAIAQDPRVMKTYSSLPRKVDVLVEQVQKVRTKLGTSKITPKTGLPLPASAGMDSPVLFLAPGDCVQGLGVLNTTPSRN